MLSAAAVLSKEKDLELFFQQNMKNLSKTGQNAESLINTQGLHTKAIQLITRVPLLIGELLKIDPYRFETMPSSNDLKEDKLYIHIDPEDPTEFTYSVIAPDGSKQTGTIQVAEIENFHPVEPLTLAQLQTAKDRILAITTERGHTNDSYAQWQPVKRVLTDSIVPKVEGFVNEVNKKDSTQEIPAALLNVSTPNRTP